MSMWPIFLPQSINGKSYREWDPCSLHGFELDCQDFIQSLENECTRVEHWIAAGQSHLSGYFGECIDGECLASTRTFRGITRTGSG